MSTVYFIFNVLAKVVANRWIVSLHHINCISIFNLPVIGLNTILGLLKLHYPLLNKNRSKYRMGSYGMREIAVCPRHSNGSLENFWEAVSIWCTQKQAQIRTFWNPKTEASK